MLMLGTVQDVSQQPGFYSHVLNISRSLRYLQAEVWNASATCPGPPAICTATNQATFSHAVRKTPIAYMVIGVQ